MIEPEDMTEDDADYDASPWTREELEALAWETGKMAGWDEMDEYDDYPESATANR